jgi:hypothetical protein
MPPNPNLLPQPLTETQRTILAIMKTNAAAELAGGIDEVEVVHVRFTPLPCDHEWDNDGYNPEFCLKCGLSFMAHAFMEMP